MVIWNRWRSVGITAPFLAPRVVRWRRSGHHGDGGDLVLAQRDVEVQRDRAAGEVAGDPYGDHGPVTDGSGVGDGIGRGHGSAGLFVPGADRRRAPVLPAFVG